MYYKQKWHFVWHLKKNLKKYLKKLAEGKTTTKISSIRRANENYNIIVHYTRLLLYYYTIYTIILHYNMFKL